MKNKKNVIVVLLLIIMVVVLGAGIYYSKNSKELEQSQLENLITTAYKVQKLENSKSNVDIIISGDLAQEDIKELNEKIYVVASDNKIKQKAISIEYNNGTSGNDDFYYEGLLSKSKLDLKNKSMNMENYDVIEGTNIADTINNYSNEKLVKAEDGNVVISIDMDTEKMEQGDILSQAKTYEDMFRRENTDKTLNEVQVNINTDKGVIYKYSSSNSDLLAIDESSNL